MRESGNGARQHRRGADRVVAEHPEQLAESVEPFVEQRVHHFDRPVSGRNTRASCDEYGIHIIPPGVDTQLWRPPLPDCKPNDGVTRLLFTGGNFLRKGGDLLLRWAKETRRQNWELHMTGAASSC